MFENLGYKYRQRHRVCLMLKNCPWKGVQKGEGFGEKKVVPVHSRVGTELRVWMGGECQWC